MKRPLSIRWWLGGLVAAVAVPLLALLFWSYALQVRRERMDARAGALRTAKATGARMRVLHTESLALLKRMALRPGIRDLDRGACASLFGVIDFLPQYADLFLFDTAGNLVCSANPSAEDRSTSLLARDWIAGELRRGTLRPGEPRIRSIESHWISILSAAVPGHDGKPHATLVLVQLPEFFEAEVLGPGSVITIIDRNGTVVARTENSQKWTGRNVRGADVAEIAMREKEGVAEANGIDGVSRQYGFQYLPELGWYIYVGVPTAVVMQPVRQLFVRGFAGGAIIVLILAIVATMLARAVERPIGSLVVAADSAARGAYGEVATSLGPREISRLAGSFNHMVSARSQSEQRLKALSERLLVVQEEERSRIARELHDDLGQSLTALKMDVLGLLEKTKGQSDATSYGDRIARTLDATVSAVQRISFELRPSILDDLGLVAALESEAALFEERSGIECELSLHAETEVDPLCATPVYRIVQEALTNVARHANATRVEIRLREWPDALLLEIRDDGCGLTTQQINDPASLGLLGIRERAELIGGTVQFEGIAGRGTIVSVRIPIPAQRSGA